MATSVGPSARSPLSVDEARAYFVHNRTATLSRARQQLFHTGDHPEQETNGGVPGSACGERPPPQHYDLFQLDKYAFMHWIDQFKPPEIVRNSLAEEPLTGSEFKQLVVLKDDIHPAAAV